MPLPSAEITSLLKAWRGGDDRALERLTPLVYEHLRKLGRQYVRKEPPGARLDATSLVHQAYHSTGRGQDRELEGSGAFLRRFRRESCGGF